MNRVNKYLIQGVRRSTGNQYVNYESIIHPEVGFPGGGLQPFLEETFFSYLKRIRTLAKESMGTKIKLGAAKGSELGTFNIESNTITLMVNQNIHPKAVIDLANPHHKEFLISLRHEMTHAAQLKHNTPTTFKEVMFGKEYMALDPFANKADEVFNDLTMRFSEKGFDWDLAEREIITETTARKTWSEVLADEAMYASKGYSIKAEQAKDIGEAIQPIYFGFKPAHAAEGFVIGPMGASVDRAVTKRTLGMGTELHRIATGNTKVTRTAKRSGSSNTVNKSRRGRYNP